MHTFLPIYHTHTYIELHLLSHKVSWEQKEKLKWKR